MLKLKQNLVRIAVLVAMLALLVAASGTAWAKDKKEKDAPPAKPTKNWLEVIERDLSVRGTLGLERLNELETTIDEIKCAAGKASHAVTLLPEAAAQCGQARTELNRLTS